MLIIVSLFCLFNFLLAKPLPTENYSNHVVLKEPSIYHLYWNYNDTDIIFETHVKTTGWVAFGLSPTGGMDNSDVVVSWIDSTGSHHFSDRHIRGTSVPIDKIQNWNLLSIFAKDGYLITKFTRKIKLCDENEEDLDIASGTPFVIFAFSSNFKNSDITYHGSSRGTQAVPLISSINSKIELNMQEVEITDFRVNYTFDGNDTDYYCKMFKTPDDWSKQKRHLIRYETLFTPGNEENLHHWIVNECSDEFESVYLKKNAIPETGNCFSNIWIEAQQYCGKVSLVWGVGGGNIQDFPNDMGYPIGGSANSGKYFMFHIHYDNPSLKNGIRDFSGIRYYTTKNYRKTEFGILSFGTFGTYNGIIVPPKTEKFKLDYGCSTECTDKIFEKQPEIHVFSSMPHTHLIGKEIYSTVVRDGKEIAYLANNKYYDFNYQYYSFLNKPVTLRKGDEVRTTCVFSTKNKNSFTYGGISTDQEMCSVIVWYYPRTDVTTCGQELKTEDWFDFLNGLKKSGEIDANLNYNVTFDPYKYSERLLNLKTNNPSSELAEKFENFHSSAERQETCVSDKLYKFNTKYKKPIPIEEESCLSKQ